MRITFIAGSVDQRGAGSNVSLDVLCKTLTDRGHSVTVLTLNISGENDIVHQTPYDIRSLKEVISVYDNPLSEALSPLREIGKETDVFHVFDPIFIPLMALYRHMGGSTPVVCRLNSYTLFCTNPGMMDGECHKNCGVSQKFAHDDNSTAKKLIKTPQYILSNYSTPRIVNKIDLFFAQSPCVKRKYSEVGIDDEKIEVVTNFYDPSFSNRETDKSVFSSESFNFLYVGRLKKIKGVDILLDAVELSETNINLDIVGGGPAKSELERRAQTIPEENRITFHGWTDHDQLPSYYRESDVFVHPGRWFEPSGRALLEAMQHGCPAIVSDIGGPPWIIGDSGLKFEPENPHSLAEKLDRVSSEPSLYNSLIENCTRRIDHFSPENIIDTIEEDYLEVLENQSRS